MPLSPFRKIHLHRIALSAAFGVIETLLVPSKSFSSVAFQIQDLNPEESFFVETVLKSLLDEYARYLDISCGVSRIEIGLLQSQVKSPTRPLALGTEVSHS